MTTNQNVGCSIEDILALDILCDRTTVITKRPYSAHKPGFAYSFKDVYCDEQGDLISVNITLIQNNDMSITLLMLKHHSQTQETKQFTYSVPYEEFKDILSEYLRHIDVLYTMLSVSHGTDFYMAAYEKSHIEITNVIKMIEY